MILILMFSVDADFGVVGMHHVGILCENLERSLDFYQNLLGNARLYTPCTLAQSQIIKSLSNFEGQIRC